MGTNAFEGKLQEGVTKMMEIQVNKLEHCMNSNQNDMDGFASCFTPFNKKFTMGNEELSQKMQFVMYTMSKCMENNQENKQHICTDQALGKIDVALSETIKELHWY